MKHYESKQGHYTHTCMLRKATKLNISKSTKYSHLKQGKCIQKFSEIARPFTKFLTKDFHFVFNEECLIAFHTLKKALILAPIIQPLDWSLPFEIMGDASEYAVGAILGETKEKKHHAIAYASNTLNGAQLNCATTEKELLAVVFAIHKLKSYLVGAKVIVFTDHAALKCHLTKKDASQD
jgi:hypothetical protein